MGKWIFKTLSSDGGMELHELSSTQEARILSYTEVLERAAQSVVANPQFSNYFVKEGVGVAGGEMVPAGNIEYGMCQALHGEESAVAAYRARYGRTNDKEIILGIVKNGNIPEPCGNCRDIMLEDFGEDFEIVSGAADGGTAVVVHMRRYLFSQFMRLGVAGIPQFARERIGIAIQKGESLTNDAYSPSDIHPERKYHALIATDYADFVGARDVMCEYHPIYALRDAVRQARRAHNPHVRFVVIVCEDFGGGAPHVMYKDRQHLLELNLQAELFAGREFNPPVYLVTYGKRGQIVDAWETSVKQWIPLPFTPRNFGPEFLEHLTRYFRRLG